MRDDREWIRKTIAHQPTGAVPYNFGFTPQPQAALLKHFGAADIGEALELPMRKGGCNTIKPLYASPAKYGPTLADEFGVVWTTNEIDRGAPIGPSVGETDIAKLRFPDPKQEYRFERLAEWSRKNREHFTVIWIGDLWERATFMRGMEQLLLDVADNPKFVQALLRGLADYVLGTMNILFQRFEFDCIALSDDYGTQHGLIISPADWRKLVKPLLAEIYGLAKRNGRYVFHHTCGHVVPIVRDMIDIGLDILHPIQPETMDIYELKKQFGRDVSFCGGLNTQQLLPRGSPQEVRDEVRRLKDRLGAGGGFILEPGITVQADCPMENILAMIDEAKRA